MLCKKCRQKHLKASTHDFAMKCETIPNDISHLSVTLTRKKNVTDYRQYSRKLLPAACGTDKDAESALAVPLSSPPVTAT